MKRVLIVDDNAIVRKTMRVLLEADFEVCGEAVDGRDAIEKAEALSPDLIVLDLSMPVMNGIQAARILKENSPSAPVILFTAHEGELSRSEAREAGISAVVSKEDFEGLVRQARLLLKVPRAIPTANRKN